MTMKTRGNNKVSVGEYLTTPVADDLFEYIAQARDRCSELRDDGCDTCSRREDCWSLYMKAVEISKKRRLTRTEGHNFMSEFNALFDGIYVPHLLVFALVIAKLSGLEKGIILYLWQRTSEWRQKKTPFKKRQISLTEWRKVLDSGSEAKVSFALKSLTDFNVIRRQFLGSGRSYVYELNTCVSEWEGGCVDRKLLLKFVRNPYPKFKG